MIIRKFGLEGLRDFESKKFLRKVVVSDFVCFYNFCYFFLKNSTYLSPYRIIDSRPKIRIFVPNVIPFLKDFTICHQSKRFPIFLI